MALPATDTFHQTTGSTQALATYSGNWSVLEGSLNVPSSQDRVAGGAAGYNTARWNADTFGTDQYSQVVFVGNSGYYKGPAVRCQSGANSSYHVDCNGTDYYLSKCLAGTQSTLVSAVSMSLANNDVVKLTVETVAGNAVLKVYKALAASPTSFSQVGSDYTDSSSPITTAGYAGVFLYDSTSNDGLASWEGGNLAGAATLEQYSFRARNDNGSETGATWYAAENAAFTAILDTNLRLRVGVNASGDPATKAFRLDYKLSTDSTYVPVLTAAPSNPSFQAVGTSAGSVTTASPAWPTHQSGDIGILAVESCGGEPVSLSTAAGFVIIGTAQATGATTNGTQLTLYWCRATSAAMGAPTVADPGDHVYAQIFTVRGAIADGDPVNVSGGGVKASASTSVSITGVTTTVDNCLVLAFCTKDLDSAAAFMSAQSNGSLSSVTEQADAGTTQGNGGGIALTTGIKAAAGASGTMTATVTSSINAFITVAIKPQSTPIMISASSNITAGGEATTAQLSAPSGKATSDFVTGRMWDDENGTDSIDITTDDYTEVEWCVKALAANGATNAQVYNFRVTVGGTVLDTYTVNPSWTLGTPAVAAKPSASSFWWIDHNWSPPFYTQQNLVFPSNVSGSDKAAPFVAIQYANPHSNGLPLWGPAGVGVTVFRKIKWTQQTGYYANFWYTDATSFENGVGSNHGYWGFHPYPTTKNNSGTSHWHEIAIDSGDYIDYLGNVAGSGSPTLVTKDQWYTQALKVERTSANSKTLTFYTNLPSVANADVVSVTITTANYGETAVASPMLTIGDSPWYADYQHERGSCELAQHMIIAKAMSQSDIVTQGNNLMSLATADSIASIWWGKTNWRTIDDLTCDFGTGRSFNWANSNKGTLVAA